jgi:hypothetical protein
MLPSVIQGQSKAAAAKPLASYSEVLTTLEKRGHNFRILGPAPDELAELAKVVESPWDKHLPRFAEHELPAVAGNAHLGHGGRLSFGGQAR